jgi:hypothetical protein
LKHRFSPSTFRRFELISNSIDPIVPLIGVNIDFIVVPR